MAAAVFGGAREAARGILRVRKHTFTLFSACIAPLGLKVICTNVQPVESGEDLSSSYWAFRHRRVDRIWRHPLLIALSFLCSVLPFPCLPPTQKCLPVKQRDTDHLWVLGILLPAWRPSSDCHWDPNQHLPPLSFHNVLHGTCMKMVARAAHE